MIDTFYRGILFRNVLKYYYNQIGTLSTRRLKHNNLGPRRNPHTRTIIKKNTQLRVVINVGCTVVVIIIIAYGKQKTSQ